MPAPADEHPAPEGRPPPPGPAAPAPAGVVSPSRATPAAGDPPTRSAPAPAAPVAPSPGPAAAASAPRAAPGPAPLTGVEEMVAEIRSRLAEISGRELELRRREQEFERQYRRLEQAARQAAEQAVVHSQEELSRQAAELRVLGAELQARRLRLDERETQLRQRSLEVEQLRTGLLRDTAALEARSEQFRRRYDRTRQILRQRIRRIRNAQAELRQRVDVARQDIAEQRAALAARRQELETQATALENKLRSLTAAQEELETRTRLLTTRAADLETREARLAAEQAELERQRAALAQDRAAVAAARDEVARRQAEAVAQLHSQEAAQHAPPEQRQELASEVEALAARRHTLQQEIALQEERVGRLRRRAEQARAQTEQLRRQQAALETLRAELEQKAAALADSEQQRLAAEQELRRAREEVRALGEQAEAREREARQAALAVEVDRQHLDAERQALEAESARFHAERAAHIHELTAARDALRELRQQVAAARNASRALPRGWAWRATAAAALAALATGLAWLALDRPLQRASAVLTFAEAPPPAAVQARHRDALLDPALLAGTPDATAWQQACAAGRVRTTVQERPPGLMLCVDDTDRARAARLAAAATHTYADRLAAVPAAERLPWPFDRLAAWRRRLADELVTLRARREAAAAAIAALPPPEELEQARAASAAREARLRDTLRELESARAGLAALLATQPPPVAVPPADIDAALAADEIFREDQAEFRAVATQFRTELTVNMLLAVDPARAASRTLAQLVATLTEQRDLDPPPEIRGPLEEILSEAQQLETRASRFVDEWRAATDAVQSVAVGRDASVSAAAPADATRDTRDEGLRLVELQTQAADRVRQLADAVAALAARLGERIETLTAEGGGSTRAVVVAAVLRGEQAAVQAAAEALANAAGRVVLTQNFELDALDRKLRGLRGRLAQRREAVAQRLQVEAERAARQELQARIDAARQHAHDLERQREEQVAEVLAGLRSLAETDATAQRRGTRVAELAGLDSQLAVQSELAAQLDEQLETARRAGPAPDRLVPGPVTVAALPSGRETRAAAAAAAAFVAAWLATAALTLRRGSTAASDPAQTVRLQSAPSTAPESSRPTPTTTGAPAAR